MLLHYLRDNYNVITSLKKWVCNYNVFTYQKICIYNVVTFCLVLGTSVSAFELLTPVREGQLVYGRLLSYKAVYCDYSMLNMDRTLLDEINGIKNENKINKYKIAVDPDGYFVFGIPQNASEKLILYFENKKGIEKKEIKINKVQWKEDIVNGLPTKKVILDKQSQERVKAEGLSLQKKRAVSETAYFPKKWILPVEKYSRISSPFGATRILNGIKKAGHSGTDFAAPIKTKVVAPSNGRVVLVHPDMFYSGKTILINHGYGVFSSYSHLNHIFVSENQLVKEGEIIGEVGTTGRSTGPHLHFAVTWFGVRVSPEFILSEELNK